MSTMIIVAFLMVGLTGFIHYRVLHGTHRWLTSRRYGRGTKLLVGLYAAIIAHVAEACLYAVAFIASAKAGLGGFRPDTRMSAMETVYFSLVNYSSLGLGDTYPTGHLRFLAGVESLNGFLLISCSASLIYLLMTGAD